MTETVSPPAAETAAGSFAHVSPESLVIGDNVRDTAGLDERFLDSIRQHGVLVPVTVVRDADALIVRDGQRRTLAARAVELAEIPVYILPTVAADLVQWHRDRVVQQIVANDQHSALNDAQRARGIQQLLADGLTVEKTAKLLGKPRTTVKAAAQAAKSEAAMDALSSGQLSLDQAAAVAEFADDDDAVSKLLDCPATHFEHIISRMRRERQSERALQEATRTWESLGYRILAEAPRWDDPDTVCLDDLAGADGAPASGDVVDGPDHWAVLLVEEEQFFDVDSDAPVDEESVDWSTRWNRSRSAAEGSRHFDSVVSRWTVVPEFFCTDLPAAGLSLTEEAARRRARPASGQGAPVRESPGGDTEKDSRRAVVALNKLGEAAAEVRRRWITEHLLSARKLPKGAATFIATMLVRERGLIGDFRAGEDAAALLGLRGGAAALEKHLEGLGANSDGPAQVVTFALVLGALEGRCTKDSWRDGGQSWRGAGPRDLLRYLISAGYTPADIELVILGEKTAEDCL